jgi:hypothetical protein
MLGRQNERVKLKEIGSQFKALRLDGRPTQIRETDRRVGERFVVLER